MLPTEDWQKIFLEKMSKNPHLEPPVAAMQVIQESLYLDDSTTMQEIIERMKYVRAALGSVKSVCITVMTAGEMFTRFITRAPTAIENAKTIDDVREILISRGTDFLDTVERMPAIVAKIVEPTLGELGKMNIITNSWNRCVLQTCLEAQRRGHCPVVYVTAGYPKCLGERMVSELQAGGVVAELVPDTALEYCLDRCHYVIMGAVAVCRNGGVIGEMGSSTIAKMAYNRRLKVVILVETFRFTEMELTANYELVQKLERRPDTLTVDRPLPIRSESGELLPVNPDYSIYNSQRSSDIMSGRLRNNDKKDESSKNIYKEVNVTEVFVGDAATPTIDFIRPHLISRLYSDIGYFQPVNVPHVFNSLFT